MSKEAMKQALEAMMQVSPSHHSMPNRVGPKEAFDKLMAAITSLRQAIAEAEKQEPVAWINEDELLELLLEAREELKVEPEQWEFILRIDAAINAKVTGGAV
jgi:hypothetical protein